jgi:hypothetical protein
LKQWPTIPGKSEGARRRDTGRSAPRAAGAGTFAVPDRFVRGSTGKKLKKTQAAFSFSTFKLVLNPRIPQPAPKPYDQHRSQRTARQHGTEGGDADPDHRLEFPFSGPISTTKPRSLWWGGIRGAFFRKNVPREPRYRESSACRGEAPGPGSGRTLLCFIRINSQRLQGRHW